DGDSGVRTMRGAMSTRSNLRVCSLKKRMLKALPAPPPINPRVHSAHWATFSKECGVGQNNHSGTIHCQGPSGVEVETRRWNVYRIRSGLVIRVDLFETKAKALETAALPEDTREVLCLACG